MIFHHLHSIHQMNSKLMMKREAIHMAGLLRVVSNDVYIDSRI